MGLQSKVTRLRAAVLSFALLMMATAEARGQVSISTLRASVESSNLELVTLQGIVHLTRRRPQQLGGACGATAFTLVDDSGSIEVTVRRAGRLLQPLRDGDRIQVTAQVHVFHNNVQLPLLVCLDATEIHHLPS
ncbi:MAG TPA: OB-fold nucleic acid binding domain-containing protein [Nitrospiraceae bacterium]|nr:OB-fold nucleic acid binding domain-containing protein [Nitrospiraceae bacterium]